MSTPATTSRLLALDALVRIEDGAFAHVVVPAMLAQSDLADRDRAFATELVYGSVRAQRRLDDLLAQVVKRPLRRLDPPVRAGLRLGAYQLLHGTPPHAAVASTVDAVGARSPRSRGFVNANLRALIPVATIVGLVVAPVILRSTDLIVPVLARPGASNVPTIPP